MTDQIDSSICPSCGSTNMSNYCAECGEKRYERIRLRDVLGDFITNTLEFEGHILKTIKHLTLRPGSMVNSYLSGSRKSYYKPVQYYILMATVYFLIFYMWEGEIMSMFNTSNSAANNPALENMTEIQKEIIDFQTRNIRLFNFLQVPIYAWLIWLFFRKKKRFNYTESLVISLYITGHIMFFGILTTALIFIDPQLSIYANGVITMVYFSWALYHIYRERLIYSILKSLLILMIDFILYGTLMAIIAVLWVVLMN